MIFALLSTLPGDLERGLSKGEERRILGDPSNSTCLALTLCIFAINAIERNPNECGLKLIKMVIKLQPRMTAIAVRTPAN